MGWIWDNILIDPMVNTLIVLTNVLFDSFGLAIIAFTIIIRAVTFPLTLRQIRSTRALQTLQPKLAEIQKKHKDPKRRQQEQMRLYREAGVNPLGCIVPMLIQLPILFALYQTVRETLGSTPEHLVSLSDRLYPWSFIQNSVPLESTFLGMNLGEPNFLMAILVGVTTFTQQATTVTTSTDPRTQSTNQLLKWMMPLMFGWLALSFPSGVALYWVVTSLFGTALNVAVFGWGGLVPNAILKPPAKEAPAPAAVAATRQKPAPAPVEAPATTESPTALTGAEGTSDGRPGSKRKKRRRSSGQGASAARPRQGPGGSTGP
jgi:YidC/Oxa1 family membrane protein insertase